MQLRQLTTRVHSRRLLAAALYLCATPAVGQGQQTRSLSTGFEANGQRDVQAVRVDDALNDGQTSWIIKPDVPRIPKIKGLDASLPPHIESRLSYAFDLAQRGATYSANSAFRSVLELCALELDAREGGTSHRQALQDGWTALDEADEFARAVAEGRGLTDARLTAARHTTRVLPQDSTTAIDPIKASQAYYAYAEKRLTVACGGLPASSLAFYGLGRTCVVPGSQFTHAAGKAALLQRVALHIAPQNMLAANELGVLLAQHGQVAEAEAVFQKCVATDATPETWRNLAILYSRKGDAKASRAATTAGEALALNKNPVDDAVAGTTQGTPASTSEKSESAPRKLGPFESMASKLPAFLRR